jgi:hypothetical protein
MACIDRGQFAPLRFGPIATGFRRYRLSSFDDSLRLDEVRREEPHSPLHRLKLKPSGLGCGNFDWRDLRGLGNLASVSIFTR